MLPSRLLIIEDTPPLDFCLTDLYWNRSQPIYDRIPWNRAITNHVRESRPDLILMSAPPIAWAKDSPNWLRGGPFTAPTLGVIQEGADDTF
jgi:hypothetical protein